MLRSGKAFALLVFFAILATGGCASQNMVHPQGVVPEVMAEPDPSPTATGNKDLFSPIRLLHLTVNPLEIKYEEHESGDRKFLIAGLKDKDIEARINDSLRVLYQDLKGRDVPPYRGIKVVIPHDAKELENTIVAHVTFNFNNVLSVNITNNRAYAVPRQAYPQHVNLTETLNFDLTTGLKFTLEKVFADDVDYRAILNDHVKTVATADPPSDDFWRMGPSLKLVAPFKGIPTNPKFHLFQSGLTLIFDYGNPEFETNYYPVYVTMSLGDLGDIVAIAARFSSKDSIFESKAPAVKELVRLSFSDMAHHQSTEQVYGNVTVYLSKDYPDDLPLDMASITKDLAPSYMKKVEEMNRQYPSEQWHINQYVGAWQVGQYVSVSISQNIHGRDTYREINSQQYCFHEDGTQLSLSDLFISSYEYKPIVRKALLQTLQDHGMQPHLLDGFLEDLQFGLGTTEVYFRTQPVSNGQMTYLSRIHFSVPFADFGCDNMTIFR